LWKAHRFDEAEPELQAELKIDPASVDVKYYLGTIYLYRDDAARAVPLLEEFVQARANEQKGFFELGRALMKTNNPARAIWALEKAAALAPGEANLHYLLAQAYRGAGRPDDARKEFDLSRRLQNEKIEKENEHSGNTINK
jgi:predicted Zn-dependent protease